MSAKKILIEAKKLNDEGRYNDVIKILLPLKDLNLKQEEYQYLLLSYSYYSLDNFEQSFYYADLVSKKNTSNEFASQLKYFCLFSEHKIDEALSEIINFLNEFPANLYKTTLEELLTDINEDRIIGEFAAKILFLANKNNILNQLKLSQIEKDRLN
ncbi:hypothetical protein ATE47_12230 [Chryseobacterium sp. IHB B 17019]|uniref:hypothetical protein n=1 Tax=Chryseobacterium sp. IHB B 17019 TaxID=1721091 RepID=UPI000720159D|nr:hypothetical protein [Chryseobacterium sp. IHB B 17019]ALR31241.1 hypothetical protein ATE47_12230 [Chryseobacterium sp. IHB B 17019]